MAAPVVDIQAAQRILALHEPIWIGYPRAIQIRDELEFLLSYPKTHRMPNMAIIGQTNNGKTMLLNNFYRKHEPSEDPNLEQVELPVLMVQAPPEPDETRLYSALLKRVFASGPTREPANSMLDRLQTILVRLKTRMIVLDEFQHAIAGTNVKQRRFFNGLKFLGNELKIPIVVAGTEEVHNALQADKQLENRFEQRFLPKWEMGEEYLRLLVSVEQYLGLKGPSGLANSKMAKRILAEGGGNLGNIMLLIRLLAKNAIRTGKEKIDLDDLKEDNLNKLGWKTRG